MTFKVPLKYADLTLGQLMTLQTEEDRFKRVASCADVTIEELRTAPMSDVIQADEHLKRIADEETPPCEATGRRSHYREVHSEGRF